MPLTWARIKEIQGDCMADDIDPPDEATAWVESELTAIGTAMRAAT